jgi:uncharacterized coiled-coil DUF342 family protein
MKELQLSLTKQENEIVAWKNELDKKLETVYEKRSELGQLKGQRELIGQRKHALKLELGELNSDRSRLEFQIEDLRTNIMSFCNPGSRPLSSKKRQISS